MNKIAPFILTLCLFFYSAHSEIKKRGRLANSGLENHRIQSVFFFAGQAKDGSDFYGCKIKDRTNLYTVEPLDKRHLKWSEDPENRYFALRKMKQAGVNVITMSYWGEPFLDCDTVGWKRSAPMQTSSKSHEELFEAAVKTDMLIMPLIESRANNWNFKDEFPTWTDGRVAPGTVSQIMDMVRRFLKNKDHPEWADRWARVYDSEGHERYAVSIIHGGSNRLGPNQHEEFAKGFDKLAKEIFDRSGLRMGFFFDPLPKGTNAKASFHPTPGGTGPFLLETRSVIGIQSFVPEIYLNSKASIQERIDWKTDFSKRWFNTGLTFLMDVSPGYDGRIVFGKDENGDTIKNPIIYGYTPKWRDALTDMVNKYGSNGMVFNSWNGYTEGMAAVPMTRKFDNTDCCGDVWYQWLKEIYK